jgi:hypothetical protein
MKILKIDLKHEYKELMLNFQKIISFFLLNTKILNKEFYLPCFIDNRGRQYYGTLLSPTFYKLYRYLYAFHEKKKFIGLAESVYYSKIMKHLHIIKDFIIKYNLNDENSYCLLILFMEIGKYFAQTGDTCFIETEDFLKMGVENYNIKNINLKFEDALYVQKIYYHVDSLFQNGTFDQNTIILKDATASGLKNYGILLNYKEEMLKYLNLDGEA